MILVEYDLREPLITLDEDVEQNKLAKNYKR